MGRAKITRQREKRVGCFVIYRRNYRLFGQALVNFLADVTFLLDVTLIADVAFFTDLLM